MNIKMMRPSYLRRLISQGRILQRKVNGICISAIQNRSYKRPAQNIQNKTGDKFWYYNEKEGYVRLSPFDPITIPNETLDKYFWKGYQRWENKTAAVCIVSGRQYTFAQMRDHCAAFAVNLQKKLKFKTKDIIAICLPNLPEYPICIFGALEAGFSVTTVNPQYTAHEISRQLANSDAKCLIGTVNNYETLKNACVIARKSIPIICIKTDKSNIIPPDTINFFDLIDQNVVDFSDLQPTEITKDDLAILPYSSGTTGLPKGVCLTHENIASNCEMIRSQSPYQHFIHTASDTHQDIIPCVLPFFHIYGMVVCMTSALKFGCKLVTMPKFVPDDLIKSIVEYKASIFYAVPPLVLFLTNCEKITAKQADRLRVTMSGAAPIGALDAERFLKKFPHVNFIQGYGLTETSPVCLMSPLTLKNTTSAGYVVPNTKMKIVAFNAKEPIGLGPNQQGEICIQGAHVMKGYFNNEEATRNTFYPDRWFRSGDIGYYDEDGAFYITDRIKELIKVKGYQVPPAELEEILRDHPKVLDAAVVGIPDQKCGELPHAFIVLRKGNVATDKEIQEYVKNKVVDYKRLEGGITFVNSIPKTAAGKILRKDLKAKFK